MRCTFFSEDSSATGHRRLTDSTALGARWVPRTASGTDRPSGAPPTGAERPPGRR
ncbi:hypothetical protein BN2537_14811 [Streptomyces venezuelae]|nr:hypothetical protein BN2537_14811 [Streptomyces venezuelae]